MQPQPLLDTILHTLHSHFGFSANAVDSVPVGYYEYRLTTEIAYADGERAELFWHKDMEDDDGLLWNFQQVWFHAVDDENPPALEIGLGVNPEIPNSNVYASITLFDVPPDIDIDDLIEITDAARWEQFMEEHIDVYIERGENIGASDDETDDEKTV